MKTRLHFDGNRLQALRDLIDQTPAEEKRTPRYKPGWSQPIASKFRLFPRDQFTRQRRFRSAA